MVESPYIKVDEVFMHKKVDDDDEQTMFEQFPKDLLEDEEIRESQEMIYQREFDEGRHDIKGPSKNLQKNRLEELIIREKNLGVRTIRRLLRDTTEEVHFSLLSQIELNLIMNPKLMNIG